MIYKVLSLADQEIWNESIFQLPQEQQDIYYTPEYYCLYEGLGDGKAKCFVFKKDGEIALYPFLMNSINKLGYNLDKDYFDIQGAYGYNGVVTSSFDNKFIKEFYVAFEDYSINENIVAEFTRFNPVLKNQMFSKNNLQIIFDRKTIFLDLQNSYEKIYSNFQTTTRKQIRRSTKRYNLEVKIFDNDTDILDDFLNIYYEAMIRVKANTYLLFNKTYFKSLIENTRNVCFMAFHEKKPIASILAFYNSYYINGHLGGALTDYLNMSPFSLLYSEMIKYGQLKGCKYLNVGGGTTKNSDDALLAFKMNFSKTTSDFYIGKRIINQQIYNEVIRQWESENPEKIEMYKNFLLKYRY